MRDPSQPGRIEQAEKESLRQRIEAVQKAISMLRKLSQRKSCKAGSAATHAPQISAALALGYLLDPDALQAVLDRLQAAIDALELESDDLASAAEIQALLDGQGQGQRMASRR